MRKKIILLISLLAVLLACTACGTSKDKTLNDNVDENLRVYGTVELRKNYIPSQHTSDEFYMLTRYQNNHVVFYHGGTAVNNKTASDSSRDVYVSLVEMLLENELQPASQMDETSDAPIPYCIYLNFLNDDFSTAEYFIENPDNIDEIVSVLEQLSKQHDARKDINN